MERRKLLTLIERDETDIIIKELRDAEDETFYICSELDIMKECRIHCQEK